MKKTTVYLSDEAVAGLRRVSGETGLPQARLVREAIETYIASRSPTRRFQSAGAGDSGRTGSIADTEERELREGLRRDSGWR